MGDNDLTKKFSSVDFDFISKPQFLALKDHYKNVLVKMKDNEDLIEITAEFSNILHVFEVCFAESQRKTQKLLELKALEETAKAASKSLSSDENLTLEFLKNEIKNLQQHLDKANQERIELLKEVEELKKTVDTQNKMIQVNERSLETISDKIEIDSGSSSSDFKTGKTVISKETYRKDIQRLSSESELSDVGLKVKNKSDKLAAATLKNNLEVLVLDLKLTRQKIEELKKEISGKDVLLSELSKDVCESEKLLADANTRISEISRPVEAKAAKYKSDLILKSEQFKSTSVELEKAQLTINQLTHDISYKESIIGDLKTKIEDLESSKEANERNSLVFERHLARSHTYNTELISEIKILKDEILALKQKAAKEIVSDKLRSEKEIKGEVETQERTIESLKNHIVLRDQKLRQTGEELSSTVDVLQNLKRNFANSRKEKSKLQFEISSLIRNLNEKIAEIKYLKEKLGHLKTESGVKKRELHVIARKHQQVVEKKNKIHSMYNHMKFVNCQQKKENSMLIKRQEYLVKILKEKDIEMEKIISWRVV